MSGTRTALVVGGGLVLNGEPYRGAFGNAGEYAALWQAGFHNVTCSMGNHLNARQFRQLCDCPRTVYLAFDADRNGSGQHAAECLSRRLREHGLTARPILLPEGHDPDSFFAAGGDAHKFQRLLEEACRCDFM